MFSVGLQVAHYLDLLEGEVAFYIWLVIPVLFASPVTFTCWCEAHVLSVCILFLNITSSFWITAATG